jgi:hypothetical protein
MRGAFGRLMVKLPRHEVGGFSPKRPPVIHRDPIRPMAKNIRQIARRMGAKIVGKTPDVGGGAFCAARLAAILSSRLSPAPVAVRDTHGLRRGSRSS